MPDNPIAGLYPQPVPPGGGVPNYASDPAKLVGVMNALNQNQMFQKTFAAQNARASALTGAIGDDGSYDPSKYATAVKASPDAAFGMDPVSLQQQRGQQIENQTKAFALGSTQNAAVMSMLGPLAQNPSTTKADVLNLAPRLVRAGVPPDMVSGVMAGLSDDPRKLHSQLADFGNIAMGPAASAGRVTGAPDASGAPTQQSLGQANVGGAAPIALPPGQAGAIEANQAAFVKDQQGAAGTLANTRQLTTALPMIEQLSNSNFGPGSPELAKIKGALTTAGIINPNTSDLQIRQEAGKYLLKYAQGATSAGRSDSALSTAIASNPNLDLTQPANLALIKNQIAMDRMDAAVPLAFDAQHPGATDKAQYSRYKSNFYQNNDQRAFSFDMMTPQERRQVIDSLGKPGSAAYNKFARSYQLAKQTGIVTPTQQPQGDQDGGQ